MCDLYSLNNFFGFFLIIIFCSLMQYKPAILPSGSDTEKRSDSCPNGWVKSPLNNCYRFVSSPKASWKTAQGFCLDEGGTLATMDNADETYWLKGYRLFHANLHFSAWIGGYKKNGQWLWHGRITDSTIVATDWAPSEPNNANGNEDCIETYGSGHVWNDLACHEPRGFICEKDLDF